MRSRVHLLHKNLGTYYVSGTSLHAEHMEAKAAGLGPALWGPGCWLGGPLGGDPFLCLYPQTGGAQPRQWLQWSVLPLVSHNPREVYGFP